MTRIGLAQILSRPVAAEANRKAGDDAARAGEAVARTGAAIPSWG